MSFMLFGINTVVSPSHSANAFTPNSVTDVGIETFVSESQFLKALPAILFSPVDRLTLFSFPHSAKS